MVIDGKTDYERGYEKGYEHTLTWEGPTQISVLAAARLIAGETQYDLPILMEWKIGYLTGVLAAIDERATL